MYQKEKSEIAIKTTEDAKSVLLGAPDNQYTRACLPWIHVKAAINTRRLTQHILYFMFTNFALYINAKQVKRACFA